MNTTENKKSDSLEDVEELNRFSLSKNPLNYKCTFQCVASNEDIKNSYHPCLRHRPKKLDVAQSIMKKLDVA